MNVTNTIVLESKRSCVRVKQDRSKYIVQPGITFMKPGTLLRELKNGEKIVDEEGNEIEPSGRFLITAETIFPNHLVTDIF